MTEEFMDGVTPTERENGIPVNMTKDEYRSFSMTLAKTFGVLKMQKPILIFFVLYLVISLAGLIRIFVETGVISLTMLLMFLLTLISAILAMTIMPARVRKSADKAYDAGDESGEYYGELVVGEQEIAKWTGSKWAKVALDETCLYLEDTGFMAFVGTAPNQKSIILPARCVTPELAKAIRETVFAEGKTLHRRVIHRMETKATAPIEKRAFPEPDQILCAVEATYEPEELMRLHSDLQWKKYTESLPMLTVSALLIGAMAAMLEENTAVFFVVSLAMILGSLIISMLSGRSRAKREAFGEPSRMYITFTQKGFHIRFSPSGREATVMWKGVERAVERPDYVELFYSGNHLLRIPKRCIDDMNELRRVVDSHFTPQTKN